MDSQITAAIIGATGAIIGAVVGAILSQRGVLDRLLRSGKILNLTGTWESKWVDIGKPTAIGNKELLVIERQRGTKVYGYITMENEADKKWNFEGDFNGRFFRLMYHPSKEAENKLFLDYGCYFFQIQGDGSFDGYSIGFDWQTNEMGSSTHKLRKIK